MDPRFDTSKDPRFRKAPRNVRKVEVDKRFAHMFSDKRFVETPEVDARGQRLRRDAGKLKLREFYELADEPSKGAAEKAKAALGKAAASRGSTATRSKDALRRKGRRRKEEEEEEVEDEDEDVAQEAADDDTAAEEEDEEEEDEGDEESEEEADASVWEAPAADRVPQGDASRRLAIMGCDWDHVSASDLLVMLRTYLSGKESQKGLRTGSVDRVAVFPSDYGIEQMAKEEKAGPTALVEGPGAPDGAAEDASVEDEAKQAEILRRYQLQRTRYYWALAECDSVNTASWLYDQLDGLEADGMAPGMLDMRFVPDGLEFPHAPHTEATDLPKRYQGPTEQRSAVGHSRVKCSWDEAPAKRKKDLMRKKFSPKEMADMDLKNYLASSDEESAGAGSGAEALKQLVSGVGDGSGEDDDFFKDSDREGSVEGDMEATFSVKASELEEKLSERAKERGGDVHTLEAEKPRSAWDKYLEKRGQKRKENRQKAKAKRAEGKSAAEQGAEAEEGEAKEGDLELLTMEGDGDDRGFNLRGAQRAAHRGAKRQVAVDAEGSFKVDVDDPRIANIFSNADFEIDPTNPEFRRSEGMNEVLKRKRRKKANASAPSSSMKPATSAAPASTPAAIAVPRGSDAAPSGGLGGGLQLFGSRRGQPPKAEAGEGPAARSGEAVAPKKKGKKRREE